MDELPTERTNFLGWRNSNDKDDLERMYDNLSERYLSAERMAQTHHNSFHGQASQSLKDGLEAAALGGGANVATNVISKTAAAAAATKTGQRISQALSGTGLKETGAYLANTAKQHPILAEKISSGLLAGVTATVYDVRTKGEVDLMNTVWSTTTGFVAGGNKLIKMTAINSGSSALQVYYIDGKAPLDAGYAAMASATATVGGYAIGKTLQYGSHRIIAGAPSPYNKYYEKKYLDKKFLESFDNEYMKFPKALGVATDNASSGYLYNYIQNNRLLEKGYFRIESYQKENNQNLFNFGGFSEK